MFANELDVIAKTYSRDKDQFSFHGRRSWSYYVDQFIFLNMRKVLFGENNNLAEEIP